jgi:hypothetical protein
MIRSPSAGINRRIHRRINRRIKRSNTAAPGRFTLTDNLHQRSFSLTVLSRPVETCPSTNCLSGSGSEMFMLCMAYLPDD